MGACSPKVPLGHLCTMKFFQHLGPPHIQTGGDFSDPAKGLRLMSHKPQELEKLDLYNGVNQSVWMHVCMYLESQFIIGFGQFHPSSRRC